MIADLHSESLRGEDSRPMPGITAVIDERPMIPAGSLILTGTPGGTAIESPSGMDRLRLMALGNMSMRGAKLAFARPCVRHRQQMGFLSVGDLVETRIQHLGSQRWTVAP